MESVKQSYVHCRRVARRAASSFYLSFFLLPKAQRDGMCALYAFLRRTDDIADRDAPTELRREALQRLQTSLTAALRDTTDDPLLPAVVDTMRRFDIPLQYFHDAIDGALMDLDIDRYESFADLDAFCYRAASVVGLACLRIWGCDDPAAENPARKCGTAFQLTNILRDVAEDAARGRIYLPLEDLAHFGCTEEDIFGGRYNENVAQLIAFEAHRAHAFYIEASRLEPLLPRDGRRAWRVMMTTYRAILDELRRRDYNVFGPRVKFSRLKRLSLVCRGLFSRRTLWRGEQRLPLATAQRGGPAP